MNRRTLTLALAGAVAVTAAGGLGALDDLTEREQDRGTKGLRGHLGALAEGRVTTGAVKLLGITAASLFAGTVLADARRRATGSSTPFAATALDAVTSGALVAGTANLLNLLDLRPGRALITQIRVPRKPASLRSCVTRITVGRRLIHRSCIVPHSSSRVNWSSAPKGSSSSSRLGSWISARHRLARCSMPPDSCQGR